MAELSVARILLFFTQEPVRKVIDTGIRGDLLKVLFLLFFFQPASGQSPNLPEDIILGTVYSYFNEEYSTDEDFFIRVDRDIPAVKQANLNAVMVWPVTQWDPLTKQLRWTRGDYLIEKIEEEGLDLSLLLFKQQQCRHYFPIWKFDEFKTIKQDQLKQLNGQMDVDFMIPEVKLILDDYLGKVLERYSAKPNIILYNVWNEPHYYSESDNNIAGFQLWLKRKYQTIGELNRVWAVDYTSWNQPNPLLDQNYFSSMSEIDWMLYKDDLVFEIIQDLKSIVRQKDTSTPMNANPVGGCFMDPSLPVKWVIDEWITAAANDIHGISYYPDIWEKGFNNTSLSPFYRHNFIFNTLRCASGNKPYILTEVQTYCRHGLALTGYMDYNTINLITWSALANDCKGFFYWQWNPIMRGRQSFGRGLTLTNGDLAPRGQAVQDIGTVLKKYGRELYNAHPVPPKAAILVDKLSILKNIHNPSSEETKQIVHNSFEGTFKALFEKDIMTDVVRADIGLTLEEIIHYKLIFLPFQIVVREHVASILKEYVNRGGMIIADSRTAITDEFDFGYMVNPGAGLTELFGVVREDHIGTEGSFRVVIMDNSVFEGVNKGDSFQGAFFREKWKLLDGALTIARYEDGSPAMTLNKYGKGYAILSGVPLGASYLEDSSNSVNKIIAGTALYAGATPDVIAGADEMDQLSVFYHQSGNVSFIYLINSSEGGFDGRLTINRDEKPAEVRNIINEQVYSFNYKENRIILDVSMPAMGVCVLRIY